MFTKLRVLVAGETWIIQTTHIKGFDSMTTCGYGEGVSFLKTALEGGSMEVTHISNHRAPTDFPLTLEALKQFDVVILSDIGSNTLLLHPDTWERSIPHANRLELLKEYVETGGGFGMVGGYLSFQGIEGKAHYAGTAVDKILPVEFFHYDDRVEVPAGLSPTLVSVDHPIMAGLPASNWPILLGYNRSKIRSEAVLLANIDTNPLLAVRNYGQGRTFIFSSDCGPHWCPKPFLDWEYYPLLWRQIVNWTAGRI